jgi:hypothetical protein
VEPETASVPALVDALAAFAEARVEQEKEKAAQAAAKRPGRTPAPRRPH